eukprot:5677518-Pyramimonas_sp.AAC.1
MTAQEVPKTSPREAREGELQPTIRAFRPLTATANSMRPQKTPKGVQKGPKRPQNGSQDAA